MDSEIKKLLDTLGWESCNNKFTKQGLKGHIKTCKGN